MIDSIAENSNVNTKMTSASKYFQQYDYCLIVLIDKSWIGGETFVFVYCTLPENKLSERNIKFQSTPIPSKMPPDCCLQK